MRHFFALLLCAALWAGEDANAKPWLGVAFDNDAGAGRVFDAGLPVLEVKDGSPARDMGIQPGDVIVSFNGTKVTSMKELQEAMKPAKVGDEATVMVQRGAEKQELTLKAVLRSKPRVPTQAEIQRKLEEVEKRLEKEVKNRRSLEEVLNDLVTSLKDVEERLPAAAEQFKKRYPNGTFNVKITVEICSDATAKDPVEIEPKTEPKVEAPKP